MAMWTSICALLTLSCPQGQESMGPMVGVPHVVSVRAGTTTGGAGMHPGLLWFKAPGLGDAMAPGAAMPFRPDFDATRMLPGLAALPDLNAISMGLDWILADDQGRVSIPTGGWGMLNLSVAPGAVGESGGLLAAEVGRDGASADLFSYIVPGSEAPPGQIDRLLRGQNADEIQLAGTPANIDAHDVFLAGYALDPVIVAMLPRAPTFFFTITPATLSRVPVSTGWWGPPASSPTPSAATILSTTWVPSGSGGAWTVPTVFLSYRDLGLAASEAVDALAVDPVRRRLLLSTTTPTRETLLVVVPTTGGLTLKDYVMPDGKTKVSKRLGLLQTDDVDAICALDPGRGAGAGFLQHFLGIAEPRTLLPQHPSHGSVSVFRRPGPRDEIETWVTGWPRKGTPQPSTAILALTFPGVPAAPLIVVGGVVKDPAPNAFPGRPVRFQPPLVVPPGATGTGLPMLFHWLVADSRQPQVFTLPYPALLRL